VGCLAFDLSLAFPFSLPCVIVPVVDHLLHFGGSFKD
jgi:hypothetical protein